MNDNFEDLFKEIKINGYIETEDGYSYLPFKNEMRLREKGFNINDNIIEKLIERYQHERQNSKLSEDEKHALLIYLKNNSVKYFSVSKRKLVIMSITTFGIYQLYWFYQNWEAVKEQGKENISPLWRSWFGILYCDSLFERIFISAHKFGYKKNNSMSLAITYILLSIATGFLLNFYHLLKFQEVINFNNSIF